MELKINSHAHDPANAKILVENLTNEDVDLTLLMLLYDNESKLQKIYIRSDKTVPANGVADANLTWVENSLSPIPAGYSIKVMAWDRDGQPPFANLSPLTKASSITAK